MTITSPILRDTNNNVSIVRMSSSDTIAGVAGANYIRDQQATINALNNGPWRWYTTDMVLCSCSDGNAFFEFTDDTFSTLVEYGGISSTVTPQEVQTSAFNWSADTGPDGTEYIATLSPPPAAYTHGLYVILTPAHDNTVEFPTLNVNGLGAKNVMVLFGTGGLDDGYLTADVDAVFLYNIFLDSFMLQNPFMPYTDGQIQIGSSSGVTKPTNLTQGSGVTITNASNSITISATGSGGTVTSINAGTGITCTPDPIIGTGTVALTVPVSLTNGGTNASLTAVQGGVAYSTASAFAFTAAGTSGQLLQSAGTATPVWTTATFPATAGPLNSILISNGTNYIASTSLWPNTVGTTGTILRSNGTSNVYTTSTFADTYSVSTLLYASAANTVSGLATANRAALSTNATGVPTWLALTDGQLVIGSTAGAPAAATLTQGTGVTITNASNSITISATGGGLSFSTITAATLAAAVNHGYVLNHAATPCVVTLPATAAVGDAVEVIGLTGSGGWTLTANTGQTIVFGSATSSTAGSWSSTNAADSCIVKCVVANTTWQIVYDVSSGLTPV